MKIARFFSALFGALGCVVLLGSIVLCLFSLNAPVRVLELPREAVRCADGFAQALDSGDLTAAAQYVYGQPDLGAAGAPEQPETAAVWDAFLGSMDFAFAADFQAADQGLTRRATVTTLDLASVTAKLPERTQTLVDEKIASAGDISEIYDDEGHFRQELVDQILHEALQQTLSQDAKTVTREVTIRFLCRDGQWWAVPDQTLLQAISGLA